MLGDTVTIPPHAAGLLACWQLTTELATRCCEAAAVMSTNGTAPDNVANKVCPATAWAMVALLRPHNARESAVRPHLL